MSRGLGRVQRAILAMIEVEPHGAWTVDEICRRVYPTDRVKKKQCVAVLRAVKRMKLPGAWTIRRLWYGRQTCCLYDECDDESQLRAQYANYRS